jgi:hypothetical protein
MITSFLTYCAVGGVAGILAGLLGFLLCLSHVH